METLFNSPDKWESKYITADGYNTHYIEAGKNNPEPLILVHGGACEIGMGNYRWYPNIIPLGEHFHVHAVDELGHGYTDPPRNLEDLGHVRVRAEHVISFIEALDVGPVNLAGQSQGGWIVAYVAIKRPDLVKKLVLIDSASTAGSALKTNDQNTEEYTEIDGVKVKVGSGELPYFKEIFEPGTMLPKAGLTTTSEGIRKYVGSFCYNKTMVNDEFVIHLMELSGKWNELYMAYQGKAYWEKNGMDGANLMYFIDEKHIREHVIKITTPTLLLWGKNSNKGIDPGYGLYKKMKNTEMAIFDKANHFLWLDQPDKFNTLVTWFLNQQD